MSSEQSTPPTVSGPGPLLPGRVAVITGAGAGIGAAAARLFAAHGAEVVVADISAALAATTVEAVTAAGGSALAVETDVTVPEQVTRLAATVLERHGRCDILVNNVGHWLRNVGPFVNGDMQFWDELHKINFVHVMLASREFLPSMIERRSGVIINVSSIEGLRGYPEDPVYAAYKAAVIQFTRSLAVQVGHLGIRVNGIGPDVTESLQVPYGEWVPDEHQHLWPQWVPVGRMGVADDQARALLFLASDLSSFVTGHTIPTDGGTGAAGGWYRSGSRSLGRQWTNRPINP
ncbi:MAG: SDR family oxidoreductase [Acidobacteriota bacterium]|nr:SDR family oxidoreductase [Acidobacteriota bacterium]